MLDLVIVVATAIIGLLIGLFWLGWGSNGEEVSGADMVGGPQF